MTNKIFVPVDVKDRLPEERFSGHWFRTNKGRVRFDFYDHCFKDGLIHDPIDGVEYWIEEYPIDDEE